MRLVYVTSRLPYGPGEGFIIAELLELQRREHPVRIVPTLPRGQQVHEDAETLFAATEAVGLFSPSVLAAAAVVFVKAPLACLRLLVALVGSRNPLVFAKNIAVYPKGLWLSKRVRELRTEHLHAHWGGTSATLAMIAAELSRTPWSFTVHRWDITEDNLLRRKAASACFVRSISRIGSRELQRLTDSDARLTVLNMGVPTGFVSNFRRPADNASFQFRILMAANFLEVKGHRFLLAGVALLQDRGCDVRVDLAGDGPLRSAMERRAQALGIAARTSFLGQLSHGTLLAQLRAGTWDLAVLTSVETASGEKEGIPVSLMEAMSCEVPVVATSVGGVSELLEGGAGLLVPQRDAVAVADAIELLMSDPERRRELARAGRRRVEAQFAIERVVPMLVERFEECSGSF